MGTGAGVVPANAPATGPGTGHPAGPPSGIGAALGPALAGPPGHTRNANDFAAPPSFGPDADFVGQELSGYLVQRKLAEGGMGVVYEGVHTKIGRRGAIKVLKVEFCRNEEVVERFKQEARAVNEIRHENIVDIFEFGRDPQGRVYFVMEYLEGEPLSARIRRGALTWAEAFPILDQMLRALKAAHDKGFVHRDLKPDNIWLGYVDGRVQVKLLDFGIAKLVGTDSPKEKLTQTGSVIGTPHYMSPEQINGSRDIDQRTDIYALGIITYEMFAGVTPFTGETLQAVMTGHLFKDPPRLADIPPILGVPKPIAEIVDRMLVKDANARYDSVAQVLADLHDVHRNQPPTVAQTKQRKSPISQIKAPSYGGVGAPAKKSKKTGVVIGAVLVAAAAAAGIVLVTSSKKPETVVVNPQTGTAGTTQSGDPTRPVTPTPAPPERIIDVELARKDALALMHNSLRETEPKARVAGTDALAKAKDQPAVPKLAELTEKDADPEVRGHAAEALGALGAKEQVEALTKLEAAAPPPLKVWYAASLAKLGDAKAIKRLQGYARDKDLAVAVKASFSLAEVSQPGDKKAIDALKALAAQEAKLNDSLPYAGALILAKLAALREPNARKILYTLLESTDEGTQLAAAEALAKLGDDAGKEVLAKIAANKDSPNQLAAAVAQIKLGEYGGLELITAKIDDKDASNKRMALGAIGEIGDTKNLEQLIELADKDKDWTVRIAAASAIVSIVGPDPALLAQASVDWAASSLNSQDWATRQAAAGVLADIGDEKKAVPLLAQAFVDKDDKVRLAASRSAGKMRSKEAALQVVASVRLETNEEVQAQQAAALGQIGQPEAKEVLAELSKKENRVGVIAAGSLIALGDPSGKAKLDQAIDPKSPEPMRRAAMQAATDSNNKIVIPTLAVGAKDKSFEVRFAAAEGLSQFNAEKDTAVLVLNEGLKSKDSTLVGRALAGLTRLGAAPQDAKTLTPEQMVDSTDPKQRLAAVPVIKAMPVKDSVPLLRKLVADRDQNVRRAGVEAIESLTTKTVDADAGKEAAIRLYKPLVNDSDRTVSTKASGQLAKLAPKPEPVKATPPPPVDVPPPPPPPPVDTSLEKVKAAHGVAFAAVSEAKKLAAAMEKLSAEAAVLMTQEQTSTKEQAKEMKASLEKLQADYSAALAKIDASVKEASGALDATSTDEAKKLAADATNLAKEARRGESSMDEASQALKELKKFLDDEKDDEAREYITKAGLDLQLGDIGAAQAKLNQALKILKGAGKKPSAEIEDMFAQIFEKRADAEASPDKKRKLLEQAKGYAQRAVRGASGNLAKTAKAHLASIERGLAELPQ